MKGIFWLWVLVFVWIICGKIDRFFGRTWSVIIFVGGILWTFASNMTRVVAVVADNAGVSSRRIRLGSGGSWGKCALVD